MYEKGSTVCLNFTINDVQITNVIKRNYSTICVSVTESIPPNVSPFGNKTMNCSITANKMSVCFGDFQIQDVGLFSLCDSAAINSNCFENITLKIIGKSSFVLYVFKSFHIFGSEQKLCHISYIFPIII